MTLARHLLLLPLVLRLQGPVADARDEAMFTLNCPQAPCWRYWNGNCYCIKTNQKRTWMEALKFCKQYRDTELLILTSILEKNWILGLTVDNFWIGLNNLENTNTFSWSEGTPADMRFSWLQLLHPVQSDIPYCVKVSKRSLIASSCNTKAHWICKRGAFVDQYQEHKGKVLLSPPGFISQVHADLISAKAACLELREQCTGITTWNNSYALARGTILIKSEQSQSVSFVKSDCSMGYFGSECSFVCSQCLDDDLCNPFTGMCDNFHSCSAQDSPSHCERALTSVWCPRFPGWKYWKDNCYYFSEETKDKWSEARKQCRRFRAADLLWIENKREMNWIISASSAEILWTGLNSRKQKNIWVWSNMKSAAKEIRWLPMTGSPLGRCVGLSTNKSALRLNCDETYKWICKRKESEESFDIYIDRFLSGPLEPVYYSSISIATVDCLRDPNCTGIVKDYQYFRRTKGIDEINVYEETASSFVKRECSFGYYGENCAFACRKCYGGFRCNSVTGRCPERTMCIGRFKGELCELGIKNPKCPQNTPWWYYNGYCYYFEKKLRVQHARAYIRCTYYKDGNLVKIDSEKEKTWLGTMLETDSWTGLLYEGTTWKWSGSQGNVNISQFSWLKDIPILSTGCVQMMRRGRLQSLSCTENRSYICEKPIDVDVFIDYPGKIILDISPLAMYKDLDEARFLCILNTECTGISSLKNEHFLVSGIEMVGGSTTDIFRLKTSAVSERCPDMDKWHYWNRHCYYISEKSKKSWKDANSTCSRFRAAELLWIENKKEVEWMKSLLTGTIWIGLQNIDQSGVWTWSHGDNASRFLEDLDLPWRHRWRRCVDLSPEGIMEATACYYMKNWVCKKPAERDLDIYTGFWDSVIISETSASANNSTYHTAKEECIKDQSDCIGFVLWQYGYYKIHDAALVGGGFGPSVTFLKSACDYGYYGMECEKECPRCYWDKPCHPITGMCEGSVVCTAPQGIGACDLGLYSLKCPFGVGWWFWKGNCYLIEKTRKVKWKEAVELCKRFRDTHLLHLDSADEKSWLREMITSQMWIGMSWNKIEWQWENGLKVNTKATWLNIEGDAHESCGTLHQTKRVLQSAKCSQNFHFICKKNESMNIFQPYNGYIIVQRQNVLPKYFYDLSSAKEDCIFERTTCTGIIFTTGFYYMVSGIDVFKSTNVADLLYVKTGCNPGFYGTNCQFECKQCPSGLPCHGINGECVGTSTTRCSLDSQDPKCKDGALKNPCPTKLQWYYYLNSCYYVEDKKTETWTNARTACQGFKGTDLVKIKSSLEKMWVQYKGDNSWIGLTFNKRLYQYFWIDGSFSDSQNAWVIRKHRRFTQTGLECGVAFKKYLSVTDCSQQRKWICKREGAVNLLTEHIGRSFYFPSGKAPTYPTLDKAKKACLVLEMCTGVLELENKFMVHTGIELYNTRNKTVKTWIKSECSPGRFGEMCEQTCRKCDDDVPCNPYTGLCADSLFCSNDDSSFNCKKGFLIAGRCPLENGWLYWRGSCYYIYTEKNIWIEARDVCRHHRGTDLLWITSKEEKMWILSQLPSGFFWTGLNGIRHCRRVHWSYTNFSFTPSEWLKKTWTIYRRCCMQLEAPSGSMPATSCYWKTPWVCKRKEEDIMDFRKFDGYYLVSVGDVDTAENHSSLNEALQLCRFQTKLCTAVQRIKNVYTTFLAKRLVLVNGSSATGYTAYLKTACTPGYFGPKCGRLCTCNGTDNCNPLNGQCIENEQCKAEYVTKKCEQGVISLKCPKDPGWWYWENNCYYIESVTQSTWAKALDFCTAYHETSLLPVPTDQKEKIWLSSMIKEFMWIGSAKAKTKDPVDFEDKFEKATYICTQMDSNGIIRKADCPSLAGWICKRSDVASVFWKYPGKILTMPLGNKVYEDKEHAKSACFLEEKCTGITYWRKQYVPVSGTDLALSSRRQAATFMKTVCSEGRYGSYCQEKCPKCPDNKPCNRLTGKCAAELICEERNDLRLCEFKLQSKFCYPSWIYFSGRCYYISTFGQLNNSEAEYMCSRFKGGQLLEINSTYKKVSGQGTLQLDKETIIPKGTRF
ncbi:uncharacterized protein LOC143832485 isoform X2 [Paroedura picta]|uniref:uncharacterized protein LOC143832485 isoform X2 n=1 Tax=Paroedura picta TaxID=143630 RepID=UPI0040569C6A